MYTNEKQTYYQKQNIIQNQLNHSGQLLAAPVKKNKYGLISVCVLASMLALIIIMNIAFFLITNTTFLKAFNDGITRIAYDMGCDYLYGNDVDQDFETAVSCFTFAAKRGNCCAMSKLGLRYLKGQGIEENKETGMMWIEKAIDAGCEEAMYSLGYCYYLGLGVPQNTDKYIELATQAAECGNINAMSELGDLYFYENEDVDTDYEKAYQWYLQAAKLDDYYSLSMIGYYFLDGYNVVNPDEDLAFECFQEAADNDDSSASYGLGYCYEYGYGTPRNMNEAISWYEKAGELGYEYGYLKLSYIFGDEESSYYNPEISEKYEEKYNELMDSYN